MVTKDSRIFVAGHNGMVGSAIVRALGSAGYRNLLTASHTELDLTSQSDVHEFMKRHRPDHVVIAAAKVGGINANNTYPAQFIYENLMIECNLIQAAHESGCKELLFLGSSCIYPRLAPQPMKEDSLLNGHLEPTNEPYAVAKIAGIKMCESFNRQYGHDYRSLMPTNLYGPGDNFHLADCHVIPALMRRMHEAKDRGENMIEIWGSGSQKREFLHVDDLAAACIHIMSLDADSYRAVTSEMLSHLNVGTGTDVTIKELAEMLAKVVGFTGELRFDASRPDGAPRKLLDVSRIESIGWTPQIPLEVGLRSTYRWFLENLDSIRK